MKRNLIAIVVLAITVGAFAYFFAATEDVVVLKKISPGNLCFLLLLCCTAILANGGQFKYLSKVFNIRLTFTEWFGLTVINTMFNYFVPARGGMIARALYMKKRYDLTLSEYASLMAGATWFGFLISSLSAVILCFGCYFFFDEFYKVIMSFSLITLSLCIAVGVLVSRTTLARFSILNERVHNILSLVGRGLHRFKDNTQLLVPICCFSLCFLLLSAARLYWAFLSIGIDVHWLKILLVQAFSGFLLVVSITPGNLGIREGFIGLFASVLGISVKQAILGALVDRIMMMIVIFVFGIIYSKLLLSRLSPVSIDHDK